MKARIILWNMDGNGEKWVEENIWAERVELVQIIPPDEKDIQLNNENIDLLLIAKEGIDRDILKMLECVGFGRDRVVFLYALTSWYKKFDLAAFLLKDKAGGMRRLLFWHHECREKDYYSGKVEGLTFVNSVNDKVIMPTMIRDGQVWSADEMHLFYKLAHEYYAIRDDEPGYFLDLGANIGTTCIYFRKKIDTNVEIIAFEPDDSNNKLLQINLVLNGLVGEAYVEAYGLSDRRENKVLYYDETNPGGTSLVRNSGGTTTEVPLISLDEYFAESGLDDARIKYIWIDTEGFEPLVVGGARNILKKRAIPLYMEFNPYWWNQQGLLQTMVDYLHEAGYTKYILIQEYMKGRKEIWPVDSLIAFKDVGPNYLWDIFLIKGE